MLFEEAARQHKRFEKVQEVLSCATSWPATWTGLTAWPSLLRRPPDAVEFWFVAEGYRQAPVRLSFEVKEGKPVPLDRKLRETLRLPRPECLAVRERAGIPGAAGALVLFELARRRMARLRPYDDIPYRKLVHAISRVARQGGVNQHRPFDYET